MRMRFSTTVFGGLVACAFLVTGFTGTARAQSNVSVGITAGSPGIGAEIGVDVSDMLGLRVMGAYFPYSRTFTPDNVSYDGDLKLLSYGAVADLYLFDSGFRLTGGAYLNRNRLDMKGTPNGAVTIGSTAYTPAQIGTLTGRVSFRDIAPYAGLGYAGGRGGSGFAFTADAGVMFQGGPRVALAASGPIAAAPGFAANLEQERQKIASDIDWLRFYPAVKVGVLYRF